MLADPRDVLIKSWLTGIGSAAIQINATGNVQSLKFDSVLFCKVLASSRWQRGRAPNCVPVSAGSPIPPLADFRLLT